jgi:hypothetical protein
MEGEGSVDRSRRTKKNKGEKTNGRRVGTPGRAPRHITEIGPWLADSEAVLRLVKQRLEDGASSPAELKLFMEYGFGRPRLMEEKKIEEKRMYFVTTRGLPWQHDPMALQERDAILAQRAEEERQLRMPQPHGRQGPELAAGANDPPAPDVLEVVRPVDYP